MLFRSVSQSRYVTRDQRVYFESLQLAGDKSIGYDVVVGLFQSKAASEQVKSVGGCMDAVGFTIVDPEEDYDDEDD